MQCFSRVIARPEATKQQAPAISVTTSDSVEGHGTLPPVQTVQPTDVTQEGDSKPCAGLANEPRDGPTPLFSGSAAFLRLLTLLARPASTGSVPSLCSNDSSAGSTVSVSPTPPSPPPTGCSVTAVHGSPSYADGFEKEHNDPRAHLDSVRNEPRQSQQLRCYARIRDADYRGMYREYNVPATMGASRLSQRVRTPPPLNTLAIQVDALTRKFCGDSYQVEVAHVDGSAISDAESGFDADDEDGYDDSPEERIEARNVPPQHGERVASVSQRSWVGEKAAKMRSDHPPAQPARKTYAAAVASSPGAPGPNVKEGRGLGRDEGQSTVRALPVTCVREIKDWTGLFERRGPLVEATDV